MAHKKSPHKKEAEKKKESKGETAVKAKMAEGKKPMKKGC